MKIFLSVPFSGKVDADGNVEAAYRKVVESLIAGLRAKGHVVYCALEFSAWKMGGVLKPEDEFKHDFEEIDAADKLIVLFEERISAGVQIEIGYAYAHHKTIEAYQIGEAAWTNQTFAKVGGYEIIQAEGIDHFAHQVLKRS